MHILAVETSGDFCSVALWRDGKIDACEKPAGQRQSGMLIDMVHGLLRNCDITLAQLDGIAYGAGPGAFTGLRVACGVVQGLAMGIGKPVVGIGTLLALAQSQSQWPGAERVVCCIDARMNEVYHAAYEKSGPAWKVVHEPGVYAPGATPILPEGDWRGCGNGFAVYAETLQTRHAQRLAGIDAAAHPHAREVALLGAPVIAAGAGHPAECAAPVYIRDKVALKTNER